MQSMCELAWDGDSMGSGRTRSRGWEGEGSRAAQTFLFCGNPYPYKDLSELVA